MPKLDGVSVNKTTLIYVAIFLAGVVLADKVRQLPVLSKLPSV
jgi:hypothetical protein